MITAALILSYPKIKVSKKHKCPAQTSFVPTKHHSETSTSPYLHRPDYSHLVGIPEHRQCCQSTDIFRSGSNFHQYRSKYMAFHLHQEIKYSISSSLLLIVIVRAKSQSLLSAYLGQHLSLTEYLLPIYQRIGGLVISH